MNIHDFVQELRSFASISANDLKKALDSNITRENNTDFDELVEEYCNGEYDDDIDLLVQRTLNLL